MADKPRIVGPDGNIPESQRSIHTAMTEKARVQMGKTCTEGRAAELIVAGVAAGLSNMQSYFVKENARLFEEMEQIAFDRVLADIRRRSLRGRLEVRWVLLKEWARPWLMEAGLIDPTAKPSHVKLEGPTDTEQTIADFNTGREAIGLEPMGKP